MEATAENLTQLWSFNWGAMEVLIGGKSSIDLTELEMRDLTDSTEFLRYYGYDPENPTDAKKMHSVICESWNFIEKYLMPAEWSAGRRPPDDLLMADDARVILLAASDRRAEGALRQAWACAVLRVMHTLAHIDGVAKFADVEAARTQIMNRFLKCIFRNAEGQLCFGSRELSVQLDRIEWKLRKSRESIVLKLLHKKANVAETIYDLLGIRIITKNLSDVMVVVKFLREFHMVSFPNCNPARARNSLIDIEGFKHNVDMLREMLEEGRIQPHEFTNILLGLTKPISLGNHSNPHSAKDYRAVQLTCRQMIRYPNPTLQWREKLARFVEEGHGDALMVGICKDILLMSNSDEKMIEGFFPFELQVMDEESAASNTIGDASHDRYKQSQVKAARRRVLHRVLTLNDPSPRNM